MERALRPYDAARWTVVTYLPFLWRPEAHMFLKPEVTKDFATRVGHRFASDYEPRLRLDVYQSLLDLVSETEQELADLEPPRPDRCLELHLGCRRLQRGHRAAEALRLRKNFLQTWCRKIT